MTTTLQARIDSKLKKDAQKTLQKMGLDMSTGIKIFLAEVVRTNSIPFTVRSAEDMPESEKRNLLRQSETAVKSAKGYRSANELHQSILKR